MKSAKLRLNFTLFRDSMSQFRHDSNYTPNVILKLSRPVTFHILREPSVELTSPVTFVNFRS
jgi:hypothetical protein